MSLGTIAAGLSIGSSIAGTIGGLSANKDAKKAAKEQAKQTFATRMEEIRREKRQQSSILGENRARIGASNLQFSGSPMRVLQDMQGEFSRDIAWRRIAAEKEKQAIKAGAPGAAANLATIAGGVSSIANTAMNYYGK